MTISKAFAITTELRRQDEIGDRYDDTNWKKIAGLRDVIGHGYDSIDHNITWKVVINDVPKLRRKCEDIISELGSASADDSTSVDEVGPL